MLKIIVALAIAMLLDILADLMLIANNNKVTVDTSPAPAMATWTLPSCPRELTLQDGSRWAPPRWSEPGCKASIIYTVPPLVGVPTGQP